MSTVQGIEQAIRRLTEAERAEIRAVLSELDVGPDGAVTPSETPILDPSQKRSADEWIRNLREWAANRPPVHHFVDTSRESIYDGCGE